MKHLKKINFVLLPLAIWAITVIYVLLNKFIGTFTQNMEPSPVILTILVLIFNLGLQLLIICASTIYAVKKLDLTLKKGSNIIADFVLVVWIVFPAVNILVCFYR
ncbi:MAG: hypothetical protein ACLTZI_10510 [[Eubacterium] siraeum]